MLIMLSCSCYVLVAFFCGWSSRPPPRLGLPSEIRSICRTQPVGGVFLRFSKTSRGYFRIARGVAHTCRNHYIA